jgi:hypothetical protein
MCQQIAIIFSCHRDMPVVHSGANSSWALTGAVTTGLHMEGYSRHKSRGDGTPHRASPYRITDNFWRTEPLRTPERVAGLPSTGRCRPRHTCVAWPTKTPGSGLRMPASSGTYHPSSKSKTPVRRSLPSWLSIRPLAGLTPSRHPLPRSPLSISSTPGSTDTSCGTRALKYAAQSDCPRSWGCTTLDAADVGAAPADR